MPRAHRTPLPGEKPRAGSCRRIGDTMPAGPTEARPEGVARGRRRKLAAILSADAVGFSRQMHRDETGTHARLRSCREIIDRLPPPPPAPPARAPAGGGGGALPPAAPRGGR